MGEWRQTTLGVLLERVRRRVTVREGVQYRAVSVTKDGQGLGVKEPFIGGQTRYSTLYRVSRGDVVVRTITAFESPVGVAGEEHEGAHVSQVFLTYVLNDSALPDFLRLYFQTPSFWAEMRNRATGSVLRRKTISDQAFRDIPIRLPSLPEQRRIVDLVAAVDAQIEALEMESRAMNGLLRALRVERLGGVREDLADLMSVLSVARSGGTPNRKHPEFYGGDIPWLKSGEVSNPEITDTEEKITRAGLDGSSAWLVPSGTVVVAMYGATAAEVGYLAAPMSTNQAVLALVTDPALADSRFLYHWMVNESPRLKKAASGAAQPNLSKGTILREVGFPRVPLEEQRSIAKSLDASLAGCRALGVEIKALRVFRSTLVTSLLAQAISIPDSYDERLEAAS